MSREQPGRAVVSWTIALLLLGSLARVVAYRSNDTPHGDVTVSALVAESVAEDGFLGMPYVSPRSYSLERFGRRTPLDFRPPLWPLLVSLLVPLVGGGYAAAKLLSLVAGLLLPLSTWLAFDRLFGSSTGLLAAAAVAGSYLLIDFSGNGSVYVLLAHCYLLFVFLLASPLSRRTAIGLGALLGGAYLLHQSSVVLWAVLLVPVLGRWREGSLEGVGRFLATTYGVALLVVSPYFVRNAIVFGDPLFQTHTNYLFYKLGVPWEAMLDPRKGLVYDFDWASFQVLSGVKTVALWTAQNAFYLLHKLVVLGSLFTLAALLGFHSLVRRAVSERDFSTLTAVATPLAFSGLCVLWPVVKFRCFSLLLPFVFGLGIQSMRRLEPRGLQRLAVIAAFSVLLFLSAVTFVASPTHTYYYDGVLTPDSFGRSGEAVFVERDRDLRELAAILEGSPPGAVWSNEINLAYHQSHPLVVLLPGLRPELVRQVVAHYGIRYIVAEPRQAQRLAVLTGGSMRTRGRVFELVVLGDR